MKKTIKVKEIADTEIEVIVNSAEHHIEEIKNEIRSIGEILPKKTVPCAAEIFDMWEK